MKKHYLVSLFLVFTIVSMTGAVGTVYAQGNDNEFEGGFEDDPSGSDDEGNDAATTTEETGTTTDETGDEEESTNIRPADDVSSEERDEQREVIDDRNEQTLEERSRDSDADGLTDYDEINVYGTDPENPDTSGNGLEDGEMVEMGLDPTSASTTPITYEDPREVPDESFSESYVVTDIEVVQSDDGQTQSVRFAGRAQANQYITLYIFSTPVVVTVKSDGAGRFEYEYREELDDGSHEVYVASVDNSGRIMARSAGVPFTKEAAAISLGASPSAELEPVGDGAAGFFAENYILISVFILLIILIIAVIVAGIRTRKEDI